MAEQSTHDVVNQSQSVGDLSPSDAPATTSTPDIKVSGDVNSIVEVEDAPKENGNHIILSNAKMEDLDDGSVRSDTDTSRAEGSVAGDKTNDSKPLKKFAAKPVSFAKYSVPKVIAASAAAKATEKGTCAAALCLPQPNSTRSCPSDFDDSLPHASRSPTISSEDDQRSPSQGEALPKRDTRSHAGVEQEQRYDLAPLTSLIYSMLTAVQSHHSPPRNT
jgi:hypothetical protein